ncbi:E3 ubiquitin-protein ligase RNF8 isoform X2 [Peromyscus californicus insignis]|uniref:E3 ubiquitin-protein ligase RNF8 isoform X2 n=1 Tax=Peromyscus californicus insignis TaxID=564181 RepID=UPI0022A80510|nr:E3 ubiquitin-protein ligase RNF8 isoform X2 [Peromyscus californicus insignis]
MGEPDPLVSGQLAAGRSWCLRRLGMDREWLQLEAASEVTIGRGFGVTYQLISKVCPLMISRNHCVLKQNPEGQWTIMDNKSLNGVWLNRERLAPLQVYCIQKGDHIQLGVPLENKENAEYEYEVIEEDWERLSPCLAPKNEQTGEKNKDLRTKRKLSLDGLESPAADGPSDLKCRVTALSCKALEPVKLHGKGEAASQPLGCSCPKLTSLEAHACSALPKVIELYPKKQKASNPSASQSSLELFKVTMSRILKLKTQMQEKQIAVLNVKRQTRKGSSKKVVRMEKELQALQSQLYAEQAQQQARVEQLEKTFQEEQHHLQGLEKEQDEDLKQQLVQALQEHRALMEELNRSKKDFEKILQAKDKELEQTKEEKEKVQAQKEEVLSHMNDVLENELQCIICSEYFIEAVTLNCAHSFCSFCISEWMKRKVECPICRKDIESKTHSLVLDNCINKMVDNLSSEVKERRNSLLRERKAKRLS